MAIRVGSGIGNFRYDGKAMLNTFPGREVANGPITIEDHAWQGGWAVYPSATNVSGSLSYSHQNDGPIYPFNCRRYIHDFTTTAGVCTYIWVYLPRQIDVRKIGGIDRVQFSEYNKILTPPDAMGAAWVVAQSGKYYLPAQDNTFTSTSWINPTGTFTNDPGDWFGYFDLATGLVVAGAPDFSPRGDPIHFGYLRSNSSASGFTPTAEIADWVVVTTPLES